MSKNEKQPDGCEKLYTPWEGVIWQANGAESDDAPLRLARFLTRSRIWLSGVLLAATLLIILILWLFFKLAGSANSSTGFN